MHKVQLSHQLMDTIRTPNEGKVKRLNCLLTPAAAT